jgi:hypothetical protein
MLKYLKQVLNNRELALNPPNELLRFLEISYVNFGSQQKFKENYMKK